MSDAEISLCLPCSSEAPGLARGAVAALDGIDAVRDDAVLVVSELVSNAVLHSGGRGEDRITVRVRRRSSQLTICVGDAGRSGDAPHTRPDGSRGRGGFGLVLVEQLAERWDTRHDGGRVVWASLSLS